MRWISSLIAIALLQAAQPAVDPSFLLLPGRAGPLEVGMTVHRVFTLVTREKTQLVDLQLEGHFSPALVVSVDGAPVPRPLVARVREAACKDFRIDGILVSDPRYRTPEGIGVGSTLAEIRRLYTVERGYGEEGPVAVVAKLSTSFLLSGESDRDRVRSVWLHVSPEEMRVRCSIAQGRMAPAEYHVRLETSKGPMVIAVHRSWAPNG